MEKAEKKTRPSSRRPPGSSKHIYLSMQNTKFKQFVNGAEQFTIPIEMPEEPENKELAVQLQNFLTQVCHAKASRIARRDESDKNGFESWRRLYIRYAPSKRVKYLGHMQRNLTWKFTEANLEQDLNDWEAEIEKHDAGSNQATADGVKVGVLMSNAPSEIQRHLQLTTGLDPSYSEVRGVIINYSKTRQLVRKKNPTATNIANEPMDIGALWRRMKGRGKGKGGLSKGKDGKGKGKSKGKGGLTGKYGHGKRKRKRSERQREV